MHGTTILMITHHFEMNTLITTQTSVMSGVFTNQHA